MGAVRHDYWTAAMSPWGSPGNALTFETAEAAGDYVKRHNKEGRRLFVVRLADAMLGWAAGET
jgi:hypothetical protein